MHSKNRSLLRSLSLIVVLSFLSEQVAFAAPEVRQLVLPSAQKPEFRFDLPQSVAFVDDFYKAPNGEKTIVLVQDAHTNESGQINVARALETILPSEKISTVYLEAGEGDVSLTGLRGAPLERRKSVGMSYLRKGLLQGSEYLNLTGDYDFKLWGVEDQALYEKAVESYRRISESRDTFKKYLVEVKSTLAALKPKVFGPALLAFEAKHAAYLENELSLTEYFRVLSAEAVKGEISMDLFPHLRALEAVRKQEEKIDFKKATDEQQRAVLALSEQDQAILQKAASEDRSPFKISFVDPKEKRAYYALLEEKITDFSAYPELKKYLAYLESAHRIDARAVLEEQSALEEAIFDALVRSGDEKHLLDAEKAVFKLGSLFDLTVTPDEFAKFKNQPLDYDIVLITGFLNKKIMDLKTHFEKAVFLEPGFQDALKAAEEFYALTYQRDRAFLANMFSKMDESGDKKAVLITGGYHTPNLKELLKAEGVSYVCVTPQVLHPTDTKRYEKIILSQRSASSGIRVAQKRADALTTLMARQITEQPQIYPAFRESILGAASETPLATAASRVATPQKKKMSDRFKEAVRNLAGGPQAGVPGAGTQGGRPEVLAPVTGARADIQGVSEKISDSRIAMGRAVKIAQESGIPFANDVLMMSLRLENLSRQATAWAGQTGDENFATSVGIALSSSQVRISDLILRAQASESSAASQLAGDLQITLTYLTEAVEEMPAVEDEAAAIVGARTWSRTPEITPVAVRLDLKDMKALELALDEMLPWLDDKAFAGKQATVRWADGSGAIVELARENAGIPLHRVRNSIDIAHKAVLALNNLNVSYASYDVTPDAEGLLIRPRAGARTIQELTAAWDLNNTAKFSDAERGIVQKLFSAEQAPLFDNVADADAAGQHKLLLSAIDYDNQLQPKFGEAGIAGYWKKSKEGVQSVIDKVDPMAGVSLAKPTIVDLTKAPDQIEKLQSEGLAFADKLAIMLVAGGLGKRAEEKTGKNKIHSKVQVPVSQLTDEDHLQVYGEWVKNVENRVNASKKAAGAAAIRIPFAIMSSNDTDDTILRLMREDDYYGMKKPNDPAADPRSGTGSQVKVEPQPSVPSFIPETMVFVFDRATGGIKGEPGGHGAVHGVLQASKQDNGNANLMKQWAAEGRTVMFIQDGNPESINSLLALLALMKQRNAEMGFAATQLAKGERSGILVEETFPDARTTQTVIEYSDAERVAKSKGITVEALGDVANSNIFGADAGYLDRIYDATGGTKDFINISKGLKVATRLESMMQSAADFASDADKVVVAKLPKVWVYQRWSNNRANGTAAIANLTPELAAIYSDTRLTSEAGIHRHGREVLSAVGVDIDVDGPIESLGQVSYTVDVKDKTTGAVTGTETRTGELLYEGGAMTPVYAWALTIAEARQKMQGRMSVSGRSAFFPKGDVNFASGSETAIDGALIVKAGPNVKITFTGNQKISGGFLAYRRLTEEELQSDAISPEIKIDGRVLEARGQTALITGEGTTDIDGKIVRIEITQPGKYLISQIGRMLTVELEETIEYGANASPEAHTGARIVTVSVEAATQGLERSKSSAQAIEAADTLVLSLEINSGSRLSVFKAAIDLLSGTQLLSAETKKKYLIRLYRAQAFDLVAESDRVAAAEHLRDTMTDAIIATGDKLSNATIREVFKALFGFNPDAIALGRQRQNGGGAHTDWMFGSFWGYSIANGTNVAVRVKKEDPAISVLYGHDMKPGRRFRSVAVSDQKKPLDNTDPLEWTNYVIGTIESLRKRGIDVPGMDIYVAGNALQRKGLSSSAAIENAVGLAVLAALNARLADDNIANRKEIAQAGNDAETQYVGVGSGLLDQGSSIFPDLVIFRFIEGELDIKSVEMPVDKVGATSVVIDTATDFPLASTEDIDSIPLKDMAPFMRKVSLFNRRVMYFSLGQAMMLQLPLDDGKPFVTDNPGHPKSRVMISPERLQDIRVKGVHPKKLALFEIKYDAESVKEKPELYSVSPYAKSVPVNLAKQPIDAKVDYVRSQVGASNFVEPTADNVGNLIPIIVRDEIDAVKLERKLHTIQYKIAGLVTPETYAELVSRGVMSNDDLDSTELSLDLFQYSVNESTRTDLIYELLSGEINRPNDGASDRREQLARMIEAHATQKAGKGLTNRAGFERRIADKLRRNATLLDREKVYAVGALGDQSWQDKMQYFHGDSTFEPLTIADNMANLLEYPDSSGNPEGPEFRVIGTAGLGAGWRGAHGKWLLEGEDSQNIRWLRDLITGKKEDGTPVNFDRLFQEIGRQKPSDFIPYSSNAQVLRISKEMKDGRFIPESLDVVATAPNDGSNVTEVGPSGTRIAVQKRQRQALPKDVAENLAEIDRKMPGILMQAGKLMTDARARAAASGQAMQTGDKQVGVFESNVVTETDFAVQNYILDELQSLQIPLNVVAEESEGALGRRLDAMNLAATAKNAKLRVIIDPIDGTAQFMNPASSNYGSIFAVEYEGDIIAAYFFAPDFLGSGTLFEASELRDGVFVHEFKNGTVSNVIRVDSEVRMNAAAAADPKSLVMYRTAVEQFGYSSANGIATNFTSTGLILSLIASGLQGKYAVAPSAYVDQETNYWDIVNAYLIEKAGGVAVNFQGENFFPVRLNANGKVDSLITGPKAAVEDLLARKAEASTEPAAPGARVVIGGVQYESSVADWQILKNDAAPAFADASDVTRDTMASLQASGKIGKGKEGLDRVTAQQMNSDMDAYASKAGKQLLTLMREGEKDGVAEDEMVKSSFGTSGEKFGIVVDNLDGTTNAGAFDVTQPESRKNEGRASSTLAIGKIDDIIFLPDTMRALNVTYNDAGTGIHFDFSAIERVDGGFEAYAGQFVDEYAAAMRMSPADITIHLMGGTTFDKSAPGWKPHRHQLLYDTLQAKGVRFVTFGSGSLTPQIQAAATPGHIFINIAGATESVMAAQATANLAAHGAQSYLMPVSENTFHEVAPDASAPGLFKATQTRVRNDMGNMLKFSLADETALRSGVRPDTGELFYTDDQVQAILGGKVFSITDGTLNPVDFYQTIGLPANNEFVDENGEVITINASPKADGSLVLQTIILTAAGLSIRDEKLTPVTGAQLAAEAPAGARIVTDEGVLDIPEDDSTNMQSQVLWILNYLDLNGSSIEQRRLGVAALKTFSTQISRIYRQGNIISDADAEFAGKAVPKLIANFREPGHVEAWVANLIGAFGPSGKAAIPQLLKAIRDHKVDRVRHASTEAVVLIGDQSQETVDVLKIALEDSFSYVRNFAAKGLGKLDRWDETVIYALIARLADSDNAVAGNARKSLAALGKKFSKAIDILVSDLATKYPDSPSLPAIERERRAWTRLGLAEALGNIEKAAASAVPTLVDHLNDPSYHVRRNSAKSLGQIGVSSVSVIEGLVRIVRSESLEGIPSATPDEIYQVRLSAIEALGLLGPGANRNGTQDALADILANTNNPARLRSAAATSLGKIDSSTEHTLNIMINYGLSEKDELVFKASVRALASILNSKVFGDPIWNNLGDILRLAMSPERVRSAVAAIWGEVEVRPGIVHDLHVALNDAAMPASVRLAAVVSLGKIGLKDTSAEIVADLIRVSLTDPNLAVQKAAVFSLAKHATPANMPQVTATLIQLLNNAKVADQVKKQAIRVLGDLQAVAAIDDLAKILGTHPNEEFRTDASQALLQIGSAAIPAVRAMKEQLASQESTSKNAAQELLHAIYRLVDRTEYQLSEGLEALPTTSPLNKFTVDLARRAKNVTDLAQAKILFDIFAADIFTKAPDDEVRANLVDALLDSLEDNADFRNGPLAYETWNYLGTYYLDLIFKRILTKGLRDGLLTRINNLTYTSLMLRELKTQGAAVKLPHSIPMSGTVIVDNQTGQDVDLSSAQFRAERPNWNDQLKKGLHNVRVTVALRDGGIQVELQSIADARFDAQGKVPGIAPDSLAHVFDTLRQVTSGALTTEAVAESSQISSQDAEHALEKLEFLGLLEKTTTDQGPLWSLKTLSYEPRDGVRPPYKGVTDNAEHIYALLGELAPASQHDLSLADMIVIQHHLNLFPKFEMRAQGLFQVRARREEAMPDVLTTGEDHDGNLNISNIVYDGSFKNVLWGPFVLLLDPQQLSATLNPKDPYTPRAGLKEVGGYVGPGLEEFYGLPKPTVGFFEDPSHSQAVKELHAALDNTRYSIVNGKKVGMPGETYHLTVMGSPTGISVLKVIYLNRNVTNAPPGHPMHNPATWNPEMTPEKIARRIIDDPYYEFSDELKAALHKVLDASNPNEKYEGKNYALPLQTVILYAVQTMIDKIASVQGDTLKTVPGAAYRVVRKHETNLAVQRRYSAMVSLELMQKFQQPVSEGGFGLTEREAKLVAGIASQGVTTGGFVAVPMNLVPPMLAGEEYTMEEMMPENFGVVNPPTPTDPVPSQLGRNGKPESKGDWLLALLALQQYVPVPPGLPKPGPNSVALYGDGSSDVQAPHWPGVDRGVHLLDRAKAQDDANSIGFLIEAKLAKALTYEGASFLVSGFDGIGYNLETVETLERVLSPTKRKINLQEATGKRLADWERLDLRNILTYATTVKDNGAGSYDVTTVSDGQSAYYHVKLNADAASVDVTRTAPGKAAESRTFQLKQVEFERFKKQAEWADGFVGSEADQYATRQAKLVAKKIAERVPVFSGIIKSGARLVSEARPAAAGARAPFKHNTVWSSAGAWWNNAGKRRQAALVEFLPDGYNHVIPSDQGSAHFWKTGLAKLSALSVDIAHLLVFKSMAPYVSTFLFHPENMSGRYLKGSDQTAANFVSLKALAKMKKDGQITAEQIAERYTAIQMHPELPADKLWVLKWEGNKTPNGDGENTIGKKPTNQGDELGVTLADFAHLKKIVGIKYMTYVDSSNPDSYQAIMKEVADVGRIAHTNGFLFFPEDLPAKTVRGKSFEDAFESKPDLKDAAKKILTFKGKQQKADWEAQNALFFAKALHDSGIDFDVYKFTFPANLSEAVDETDGQKKQLMSEERIVSNLQEMARYTRGRLLMMLSGGDPATLRKRSELSAQYLKAVGTFSGRGTWGNSFWKVKYDAILDQVKTANPGWSSDQQEAAATKQALEEVRTNLSRIDLTDAERSNIESPLAHKFYNDLHEGMAGSTMWNALGITANQAGYETPGAVSESPTRAAGTLRVNIDLPNDIQKALTDFAGAWRHAEIRQDVGIGLQPVLDWMEALRDMGERPFINRMKNIQIEVDQNGTFQDYLKAFTDAVLSHENDDDYQPIADEVTARLRAVHDVILRRQVLGALDENAGRRSASATKDADSPYGENAVRNMEDGRSGARTSPSLLAVVKAGMTEEEALPLLLDGALKAVQAGVTTLHFDVVGPKSRIVQTDNPTITTDILTPRALAAIKAYLNRAGYPGIQIDVHLMVEGDASAPQGQDLLRAMIREYIQAGADSVAIHIEAYENLIDVENTIDYIDTIGGGFVRSALAFTPSFDRTKLEFFLQNDRLPKTMYVLGLAVPPGAGGQPFDPQTLDKMSYVASALKAQGKNVPNFHIDGGIKPDTAQIVRDRAAADGFTVESMVAGSAFFKQKGADAVADLAATLATLQGVQGARVNLAKIVTGDVKQITLGEVVALTTQHADKINVFDVTPKNTPNMLDIHSFYLVQVRGGDAGNATLLLFFEPMERPGSAQMTFGISRYEGLVTPKIAENRQAKDQNTGGGGAFDTDSREAGIASQLRSKLNDLSRLTGARTVEPVLTDELFQTLQSFVGFVSTARAITEGSTIAYAAQADQAVVLTLKESENGGIRFDATSYADGTVGDEQRSGVSVSKSETRLESRSTAVAASRASVSAIRMQYQEAQAGREHAASSIKAISGRQHVGVISLDIFAGINPEDSYFQHYVAELALSNLIKGDVIFTGGTVAQQAKAEGLVAMLSTNAKTKVRVKGRQLLSFDEAPEGAMFVKLHATDTAEDTSPAENVMHVFMNKLSKDEFERGLSPVDAIGDIMAMVGESVRTRKNDDGTFGIAAADIPDGVVASWKGALNLTGSKKAITASDIADALMGKSRALAFGVVPVDLNQIGRFWQLMKSVDLFA